MILRNKKHMNHFKNAFIADFETIISETKYYKKYERTKVYLWAMLSLDQDEKKHGFSIDSFFKNIKSFDKSISIYFHNLSFDGEFIIVYLLNKGVKLLNGIDYKKSRKASFTIFRNFNKIYAIRWKFWGAKKIREVEFKCSLILLSCSVKALGITLGINKLTQAQENNKDFYKWDPIDDDQEPPQELIQYCINDCEIVKQSLIAFDKTIRDLQIDGIEPLSKLTIGSLSLALNKQYLFQREAQRHYSKFFKINYQNWEIGKNFFQGAFAQFNPKYQTRQLQIVDALEIDVNSMYPWAATLNLPIGQGKEITLQEYEIIKDDPKKIFFIEYKIGSLKVKNPNCICFKNFSQKQKGKRYISKGENEIAFLRDKEFEMLKNFYNFKNVEMVKIYQLKCGSWNSNYIKKLYDLRTRASKEKNETMKLTLKIALNASTYGKFAQKPIQNSDFFFKEKQLKVIQDELANNGRIKIGKKIYEQAFCSSNYFRADNNINKAGYYCLTLKEIVTPNKKVMNIWVAATITSYARCLLFETINTLGVENWIYSDTDSIKFLRTPNLSKVKIDDTQLGAWKVECEINKIQVHAAKRLIYYTNDGIKKIVFAGASKDVLTNLNDFENIESQELESTLKKIKVAGGVILTPSLKKFNKGNL